MTITFTIEDEHNAFALAQYLKRVSFDDAYKSTDGYLPDDVKTDQAYQILSGIQAVTKGLEEIGVTVC